MMLLIAKLIIILFGLYLIAVGFLMLFAPNKTGDILRKAGSTNLINYTEISLRIIPGIGLILYSDLSRYPMLLQILGWFILATSFVLYFVPRKIHHNYSLMWADILNPFYFRLISPFSMLFGSALIYSVI